jgi:hypothetical protein
MDQSEPQHDTIFVGIDVAKDRLEVHLRPQGEGGSRPAATPPGWSACWPSCAASRA